MAEDIYQILYCSRNRMQGTRIQTAFEISQILAACRRNNVLVDVTGAPPVQHRSLRVGIGRAAQRSGTNLRTDPAQPQTLGPDRTGQWPRTGAQFPQVVDGVCGHGPGRSPSAYRDHSQCRSVQPVRGWERGSFAASRPGPAGGGLGATRPATTRAGLDSAG